jgi:hypothetical protein
MITETGLRAEPILREQLPPGWSVHSTAIGDRDLDGLVTLHGPGGQVVRLLIEAKSKVWPRDVARLHDHWQRSKEKVDAGALLVVAAWLSPRTREVLAREGLSYVDKQGSLHLNVSQPAVYVHVDGAARNPNPRPHELRTLRGRGAARAVRALIDFALPQRRVGVRELASASGASAATLSRVLALLEQDDLVHLDARRGVEYVNVGAVIKRWAQDYTFREAVPVAYLEPRGLSGLELKLATTKLPYALTGTYGLQWRETTRISTARAATVWVEDPADFADRLRLVPADRGGNILLLRAWDPVVFNRTWPAKAPPPERKLVVAAAGQVAVDLLRGPGREPAEGEELLRWMRKFGPRWRSPWPRKERRDDG